MQVSRPGGGKIGITGDQDMQLGDKPGDNHLSVREHVKETGNVVEIKDNKSAFYNVETVDKQCITDSGAHVESRCEYDSPAVVTVGKCNDICVSRNIIGSGLNMCKIDERSSDIVKTVSEENTIDTYANLKTALECNSLTVVTATKDSNMCFNENIICNEIDECNINCDVLCSSLSDTRKGREDENDSRGWDMDGGGHWGAR